MLNGRPAHSSQGAYFYDDSRKLNLFSSLTKTDASGWSYYCGSLDSNGFRFGEGKSLMTDGSTFIGTYKDLRIEGNLYELQANATYSLFEVKYDNQSDVKEGLQLS
jgi:hypothetical protein